MGKLYLKMQPRKYRKIQQSAYFLFPLLLLFSCASRAPVKETEPLFPVVEQEYPPPLIEQELPPEDNYLTIIAAGDNLYHAPMIKSGEEGDYETAYLEVYSLVQKADIAFINQETILGGKDFGFSGYPEFNSPQALGLALEKTGFTVVNHATNHIMDKGENAVFATLNFWDNFPDVTVLGIHRSEEKRNLPVLVKKNNITLGFLSYTYGTNYIPLPKDKPYLVSLINTEVMAREIDAIRPLCDFLVVSMHWGEEYQHDYSKTQKNLATMLAEHAVDLVIGHHPHVIQKIENIPRPDGKNMLCFYSLGNFISAQSDSATLLGAMAFVRLKKTASENIMSIEEYGAIPTVTHYEKDLSGFKVYPLYAYTEELVKKHWRSDLTINYLKSLSSKILGDSEMLIYPFDSLQK
jgi:poly-gamma-glutamate synthesis protein (capsule biosynthesis protein)